MLARLSCSSHVSAIDHLQLGDGVGTRPHATTCEQPIVLWRSCISSLSLQGGYIGVIFVSCTSQQLRNLYRQYWRVFCIYRRMKCLMILILCNLMLRFVLFSRLLCVVGSSQFLWRLFADVCHTVAGRCEVSEACLSALSMRRADMLRCRLGLLHKSVLTQFWSAETPNVQFSGMWLCTPVLQAPESTAKSGRQNHMAPCDVRGSLPRDRTCCASPVCTSPAWHLRQITHLMTVA
jgi:hypothetical protein